MKNRHLFLNLFLAPVVFLPVLALCSCGGAGGSNEANLEIFDSFSNVSIVVDTANLTILPSEAGCRVVGHLGKDVQIGASVLNGKLDLQLFDNRPWYKKIFGSAKKQLTLYLPDGEYGALDIETDTGNVEICDTAFDSVNIDVDTGNVRLDGLCAATSLEVETETGDITLSSCESNRLSLSSDTGRVNLSSVDCGNLNIDSDTGNVIMSDVIADGKLEISGNTGKVSFERCDASEVYITTDTGDVVGSFLSDKIIFATAGTGRVDVPKLTSGGRCEISTDTGNIRISIVAP